MNLDPFALHQFRSRAAASAKHRVGELQDITTHLHLLLLLFLLSQLGATASLLYVDVNSINSIPPYTNWNTAAVTIQDAVDAATEVDEIVVTNGVYQTGGHTSEFGALTSRVAVDKPLTVRSVNGPLFTIIQGWQLPGVTNGDGAVRCVYLTNGASLFGFTLTGGATRTNGDGRDQIGGGLFCDSQFAVITNCILSGNSAYSGGGGAYGGTLSNCWLTGNVATYGGGGYGAALNNSVIYGNSARIAGGGAQGCMLGNCTITGNSAVTTGGGAFSSTLVNCIVYYNSAPSFSNYLGSTLNFCCTTPDPGGGLGNITVDPQLASISHLSATSACRAAGSSAYAGGTDLDGEPWANPPSIGCDEYYQGAVTGPLFVTIGVGSTNVAVGNPLMLTALIDGRTTASSWKIGNVGLSNRAVVTQTWMEPGDYHVALWAFNEDHPAGVSADLIIHVYQPIHYVAVGSLNPMPPYISWSTATRNIQDAIDVATEIGASVLVSNGVYETGGRAVYGTLISRVTINKPIPVRSVNGPQVTVIKGWQVPGRTNGDTAVRCVYMTNGASLSGFTLTRGATRTSAGLSQEAAGGGLWCESTNSVVTNCVLVGNSAAYGGGASGGTLENCILITNSAASGGGGASGSTLNNCGLIGNFATAGGGGNGCTLNNCTLYGNSALLMGGGAYFGTLNGCSFFNNSAGNQGGGAYLGVLNNCTLVGNAAVNQGGGAYRTTLNNCIVYYNTAPGGGANYLGGRLSYCCTTPDPAGVGNITVEPDLASVSHLSAGSPCIGAGIAAFAIGTDIDGEAWGSPPSIGCDEYHEGAVTGPLAVAIAAGSTNVAVGYPLNLMAMIDGRTTASFWEIGGGVISNRPLLTQTWTAPGDYRVALWAFNEDHTQGVSTNLVVHVSQGVHYVAANGLNPIPPFLSWDTAATNIQDAIDSATETGASVLVSNGVYSTGGRAIYSGMTNRIALYKPLAVRSLNGPEFTFIRGSQVPLTTNGNSAIRCAYLTNGASLSGFTLTQAATVLNLSVSYQTSGGGVWCESTNATVSNCVLSGNSAGSSGAGAYSGTLKNCTLSNNVAQDGGGAYNSAVVGCTLSGNSAILGGGVYSEGLNDCTKEPLFIDVIGSNLRLQSNSPCINAGNNSYAPIGPDLDGNPRIVGGTVDIGAYEFQNPISLLSYAWLQFYGLPIDGSADFIDSDADGMNNWQEWRAGTNPTNALSALRMLSASTNAYGITVQWQSVRGIPYFLQRSTNLSAQPTFFTIQTNIVGLTDTTSSLDIYPPGRGPFFYRVGVQ